MWIRLMILLCCTSVLAGAETTSPSAQPTPQTAQTAIQAAQSTLPTYRLGPDDMVVITVLRHPEFSGEFLVLPDGWVTIPVVGRMMVAGKTIDELTALLNTAFKVRLREPEVNISLKTPRVQRTYVLGAVMKPGIVELKAGWRVTEVIAAAGGVEKSNRGQLSEVAILRVCDGKQQRIVVNLSKFLKKADTKQNPEVMEGDVIYVPDSRKPDWNAIFQIISTIGIAGSLLK